MSPARLRVSCLLLVTLATLIHLVGGSVAWQAAGIVALLLYLMTLKGQLTRMAKGLLCVAGVLTLLALWRSPTPGQLLFEASGRFAFFATFVVALSMLRLPAYRSRLVRRCGQSMLLQPPSRRYPILSLGSALFGIILNIGVLNLFAAMIEKSNTLSAAQGRGWVREARQRRMMLALLRGFSLAPLISPMGIGVAVVLSSLPQITWPQLAPYILGAAALIFMAGWAVDYFTGPHPPANKTYVTPSLRPLAQFSVLLIGIVALVFSIAWLLELRLPIAALLGAPTGALLWLAWQRRRLGYGGLPAAITAVHRQLPWLLSPSANEIVVLGAAGYLGHVCVGLVDTQQLAPLLAVLDPLGTLNAVLAMLMVVGLAQIGVNPIVTVTLLVGLLPTLGIEGLTPELIGASLMVGWALALMSSPMTASMLILSRFTGVTATRIGYRWNGRFLVAAIPLLALWFGWSPF
ncbi:hypothetical protein [Vreelandella aquamarina]|uniref:hypothetical protein n=1 Tax=Vreelandella aquamarina TaxID=77097 RepID=UPI0005CC4D84|nr:MULTISPECIES: hypothetical protein [Halomonas]KJD19262.1 hypothetical protein VE30_08575 [Halomonas meridiana]MDC8441200.1 hypothetical protein [Halomonas aquamarina]MDK2751618.1 hypothetical protein [Halomonas meridiana]NQY76388.1 hypothetical protein [Halomonas sp.]